MSDLLTRFSISILKKESNYYFRYMVYLALIKLNMLKNRKFVILEHPTVELKFYFILTGDYE